MVGVAGRSKACLTCRRRRKGCDFQRPSCGHCQRLGLKCDGYERPTTFVYTDPTTGAGIKMHLKEKNKLIPSPPPVKTITIPNSLVKSAFKTNCLDVFWDIYLPGYNNPAISNERNGCISTVTWLINIPQLNMYSQNPFLEKAVMAVCLAGLGRRQSNRAMIEESIKAYSAAVRGMSFLLMNTTASAKPPDDAMVAATRCLSLYEVFYGPDSHNKQHQALAWHRHRFGELALLSARKPEFQIDGISHQMFAEGRLSCTVASLATRKGTILSRPEWKEIPFSQHKKTSIDLLLDIFVDVPGFLEALDMTEAARLANLPDCEDRKARLFKESTAALENLSSWFEDSAPKWDWKAHANDTNPTTADITAAHNMCLFWAIELKLNGIIIDASLLPHKSPDAAVKQQLRSQYFSQLLPKCEAIVQTAPIFFTQAAGIAGCQLALLPLILTHRVLTVVGSDEAREMQRRIMQTLSRSHHEYNLAIRGFADSVWEVYRCHYCPGCQCQLHV
ncbi:hypothetical protein QBC38DRAFT_548097 [Podospora fimiseda]|uniref:Zn(2)-C6 fungal-type domain-containing protein n=1 Tax=Podospora fimiseda TaxID=252190 RepID=A0AAN7GPP6_9PEZI|nr:hypothetical protein QBC38DRAFT_548097 [Podospora fimiseda]